LFNYAVRTGSADICQYLLQRDTALLNARFKVGWPLHICPCARTAKRVVSFHLQSETPLLTACRLGNAAALRVLLEEKADTSAKMDLSVDFKVRFMDCFAKISKDLCGRNSGRTLKSLDELLLR
jgi:ankyrin repeat protein